MKLKIGDTVKVLTGKDKGREGKIEKTFPAKMSVLIPEVNMYKKHVKAALTVDKKGGIFDLPRPISVSKLALICPQCKKVTRIGYKLNAKGEKTRICKKCRKEIDGK